MLLTRRYSASLWVVAMQAVESLGTNLTGMFGILKQIMMFRPFERLI
jgi:hypothetical protein